MTQKLPTALLENNELLYQRQFYHCSSLSCLFFLAAHQARQIDFKIFNWIFYEAKLTLISLKYTYLHCPSKFWQSNPSYRHPALSHCESHFPSLKYRQHCRAAEQFFHGSLKLSEQSPLSQPHSWLLQDTSQCLLYLRSSHCGIPQGTSTGGGGMLWPDPPGKL